MDSDDEPVNSENEPKVSAREGAGLFGIAAVVVFIPVVMIGVGILGLGANDSAASTTAAVEVDEGPGAGTGAGEAIFASRCAACHGAAGEGGVGPAMAGIADRFPDIDDQIAIVANGRNAMPAFAAQLSAEEIESVVVYERDVLGG